MIKHYLQLMRFDKPIGIFLLMWPTLWALWLASCGRPSLQQVLIFILGTIVMRAAGCIINDIADRDFDLHVERTKTRPLTSGKVTLRGAWISFFVCCVLALLLVLQLNIYAILLSIPALLVASAYPFMKRYIQAPQVILGVAFGFGILMAYAAASNTIPLSAWLLFIANIFWVMAYDTMYAMVDKKDDLKIGIKSTAILFGQNDKLIIGFLQGLFILILFIVGWLQQLFLPYYLGVLCALGLVIYHQWLIRNRDPVASFNAFLNNNCVGIAVFLGLMINFLI